MLGHDFDDEFQVDSLNSEPTLHELYTPVTKTNTPAFIDPQPERYLHVIKQHNYTKPELERLLARSMFDAKELRKLIAKTHRTSADRGNGAC